MGQCGLCPLQGGDSRRLTLSEAINEDASRARVKVSGSLNGAPFVLERMAQRSGGSKLKLMLGGVDMSKQEMKLTQVWPGAWQDGGWMDGWMGVSALPGCWPHFLWEGVGSLSLHIFFSGKSSLSLK
jgi:hypothetical protein